MSVALYLRVSTEDQADRGTIGSQRDFLNNFVKLYNLSVAGLYEDDGVSGTVPLASDRADAFSWRTPRPGSLRRSSCTASIALAVHSARCSMPTTSLTVTA
jgi:hypothetical protein